MLSYLNAAIVKWCFLFISCLFLLVPHTYSQKNQTCTITIIPAAGSGFGYDIYKNHKLYIHQPAIPGMSGSNGFATRKEAEMVAKKVVGKLQKGQGLPTISADELKQLSILSKKP